MENKLKNVRKLYAANIKWDLEDDEIEEFSDLPKEIEIDMLELSEFISDYISNETGFCHKSFKIKAV